jgi:hypothetical protein
METSARLSLVGSRGLKACRTHYISPVDGRLDGIGAEHPRCWACRRECASALRRPCALVTTPLAFHHVVQPMAGDHPFDIPRWLISTCHVTRGFCPSQAVTNVRKTTQTYGARPLAKGSQPRAGGWRRPQHVVAGVIADDRDRTWISLQLRNTASVVFVDRCRDLSSLIDRARTLMILLEPHDRFGTPTSPFVTEIHRSFPSVIVVAYCGVQPTPGNEIVALVRAGIHDLVIRGVDDLAQVTSHALANVDQRASTVNAIAIVAEVVGPGLAPFTSLCLAPSRDKPSIGRAAKALGLSRKTLVNRAIAAGVPSPRVLMAWCRL